MPYATDSGAQLDPYMDHLWKREHGAVVSTCMPLTREPNSILMRTTSERFDACLAVELEQGAFHEVLELDHVLEWLEGSELLWRGAPDDGGNQWHSWRHSVAISGHQWSSVVIRGHQWPSVAISGHQWPSVAISMQSTHLDAIHSRPIFQCE